MKNENKTQRKIKQINISIESFNKLKNLIEDSMQNEFDRKPSFAMVVESILNQINRERLLNELQKKAVKPKDFNQHIYKKYCELHGKIDYNSFIKKVLSGEVNTTDLL